MYKPLHVILCGLLLGMTPATWAAETFAEDEELMDEFAFLEEAAVVESAARHKQEIGMSPSAITVITREDIEASGAETFADLLRMVPGMDVIVSSQFFSSVAARLNWNLENHLFLVLIDGRQANDEIIGATMWYVQPIFLDDVERIEVIRGPGSSLYGANAVAGVVSITTRAVPEKTSGWVRVAAGEPGMLTAGARASTTVGDWGVSLSGGGDVSGDFTDPRRQGRETWKLRAVAERRFSDEHRLLVEGSAAKGSGGVATALGQLHFTHELRTIRLLYERGDFRGQLYWLQGPAEGGVGSDLVFSGVRLAQFQSIAVDTHTLDLEVQWTLPGFYEPLMILVGGRLRGSYAYSDDLLGEEYDDITSQDYHQTGVDIYAGRAGAFVHGEFTPADWVTVTGGARLDANSTSGLFVSPRLAVVFQPLDGQFARLGVARAFRMPSFQESVVHFQAVFPDDSPITGPGREEFLEFMSRSVGNSSIDNEELLSFEIGYLGRFLEGCLVVSLDLYYNLYSNLMDFQADIIANEQGLPDLERSTFQFANLGERLGIFGGELSVRYNPSKSISLLATWSHREVTDHDNYPKNLITLGGRFRTEPGLLGSLYIFSRSEFWDRAVENPDGMMAPAVEQHLDNVMLVLGKLGWIWESDGFRTEAGVKLLLPFSPFSGSLFRYYERGGGLVPGGRYYGGIELARALTAYLQGSF